MKIILSKKTKKKKEIDWNKQQLLTTVAGNIVMSTGCHHGDKFTATTIKHSEYEFGKESDGWIKKYFTLFEEIVILEND